MWHLIRICWFVSSTTKNYRFWLGDFDFWLASQSKADFKTNAYFFCINEINSFDSNNLIKLTWFRLIEQAAVLYSVSSRASSNRLDVTKRWASSIDLWSINHLWSILIICSWSFMNQDLTKSTTWLFLDLIYNQRFLKNSQIKNWYWLIDVESIII